MEIKISRFMDGNYPYSAYCTPHMFAFLRQPNNSSSVLDDFIHLQFSCGCIEATLVNRRSQLLNRL